MSARGPRFEPPSPGPLWQNDFGPDSPGAGAGSRSMTSNRLNSSTGTQGDPRHGKENRDALRGLGGPARHVHTIKPRIEFTPPILPSRGVGTQPRPQAANGAALDMI